MKMSIDIGPFTLRNIDPIHDNLSPYLSWMKNVVDNPFIQSVRVDYTLENLVDFINQMNESRNGLLLGIFCREEEKHIGNIKFEWDSFASNKAVMGLFLGDLKFRGAGVGSEILPVVLTELHERFGVKQIDLGVDAKNLPAIALYKKVGFRIDSSYGDDGYWMINVLEGPTESGNNEKS
jgi:ribosomal-protein-alanine N-acetyltransferase